MLRRAFSVSVMNLGGGDNDPAVVRTVKTLSVAGSDTPVARQEKEAGSVGGIPSQ